MARVGGDGSVMAKCPGTDSPHIGRDQSAIEGEMPLCLSPAEGQTVVKLSGTR